ncbi:hypothetical protein DSM21852_00120 [Methylocystis bryophila]|uniref:Uncharacterized protein n=1 Tax=Methylocystis bryophila TaxID=655015 RepID=A0A1W6MTH5_9HYPH|nr:hypothetical protein B1812_07065 [Methylocystis bryophila]BDV36759.1 hypothetical protein DSM21852_00120 [Methylocystis bryophila]
MRHPLRAQATAAYDAARISIFIEWARRARSRNSDALPTVADLRQLRRAIGRSFRGALDFKTAPVGMR